MTSVFPEFTVWNYFTSDRADTIYYDDGADYPLVAIDQVVSSFPSGIVAPYNPPDGLASNYIVIYPDTSETGILILKFDGVNTVYWGFSYILLEDNVPYVVAGCPVGLYGVATCGIYDLPRYDSLVVIPCVVSRWHDDNSYELDAHLHPFGDADGTGEISILDASYIINYLYKGGLAPKYDYLAADANCSGNVNLLDVSYLIDYLYRQGLEPCVYRP